MLGMQPRRFERILVMNTTTAYSGLRSAVRDEDAWRHVPALVMAGMMEAPPLGPVMT